jgi:hypothetical protein
MTKRITSNWRDELGGLNMLVRGSGTDSPTETVLDPLLFPRDGARSQSPYLPRGFLLLKEPHSLHSAAQESLG